MRFVPVAPERGVYEEGYSEDGKAKASRAWIMAPLGGDNLVILEDGKGAEVKAVTKHVLVKEAKGTEEAKKLANGARLFSVHGHWSGEGEIKAVNGKSSVSAAVTVYPRKEYKVSFRFPSAPNRDGKVASLSAAVPADAVGWIGAVNGIFGRQCNIWFRLGTAEPVTLQGMLERPSENSEEMFGKKDDKADVTVFLARQVASPEANGFYLRTVKQIVCEDQDKGKNFVRTLAHELGHFVLHKRGTPGHTGKDYGLMNDGYKYGTQINRNLANLLNEVVSGDRE